MSTRTQLPYSVGAVAGAVALAHTGRAGLAVEPLAVRGGRPGDDRV
ncbi:hypothetical protein ACF09E_01405 [Streptomyces sp. NPDC014891]